MNPRLSQRHGRFTGAWHKGGFVVGILWECGWGAVLVRTLAPLRPSASVCSTQGAFGHETQGLMSGCRVDGCGTADICVPTRKASGGQRWKVETVISVMQVWGTRWPYNLHRTLPSLGYHCNKEGYKRKRSPCVPKNLWSFTLDFWEQYDLFLFLHMFSELQAAGRLANALRLRTEPTAKASRAQAEALKRYAVALVCVGDVHSAQLDWQAALKCFQESLQVCRQIVAEFGKTPKSLRDLSVSLDRVGDVWAAQRQWQDALACYQESLQVRRQIVDEFGKTPESLRDLSVALERVGDVWAAQRQWQDALACYQESLQVRRQIVDEFGKTPESLRDLSIALERVGDVHRAQRQWQDALACYQESLQVCRQIVDEFGKTPESLRDLSVALERVGDVWAAQRQWQDALACYQESLQVCRQIVDEFGKTPESLRDLSIALERVGDVHRAQRQWQDALACYQESLQVRRQIVAEFGKTPESLRDLSAALDRVGDVHRAQRQWQDALACYQESLQVRRQIVAEFGKTPESLRDLLVSHAKMALALSGMGNRPLACKTCPRRAPNWRQSSWRIIPTTRKRRRTIGMRRFWQARCVDRCLSE
jgi:tetratricopeptide (TPR) repeat protein